MEDFDISQLSARARAILREDRGETVTTQEPESQIDLLLNAFSKREEWIIGKVTQLHRKAKSIASLAEHAIHTQITDPAIQAIAKRALQDNRSDVERLWSEISTRVHQSRKYQHQYNQLVGNIRSYQTQAERMDREKSFWKRKNRGAQLQILKEITKEQEQAMLMRQQILGLFDDIVQVHDQLEKVVDEFVRLMDQVLKPHRVTLHTLVPYQENADTDPGESGKIQRIANN